MNKLKEIQESIKHLNRVLGGQKTENLHIKTNYINPQLNWIVRFGVWVNKQLKK